MKSQVCVDASLVVAMFMPERFSRAALTCWKDWMLDGTQVAAPVLLRYEVVSAVYRKVLLRMIQADDCKKALQNFLALDIEMMDAPDLSLRAMELAEKFNRPNTYDAHYLALAEHLGCPFWTGDERLYNAARSGFDDIFWLGEILIPGVGSP
jgi:predicted nucleic acid-binding protein